MSCIIFCSQFQIIFSCNIERLRVYMIYMILIRILYLVYIYFGLLWVVPPPSNSGKWRFIGIPDPKNIIILMVTGILGRRTNHYILHVSFCHGCIEAMSSSGSEGSSWRISLFRCRQLAECLVRQDVEVVVGKLPKKIHTAMYSPEDINN